MISFETTRGLSRAALVLGVLFGATAGCIPGPGPEPKPEPEPRPQVVILPEVYEGGQTIPMAISDDGKVVVGYCSEGGEDAENQAFRWADDGTFEPLGFLSGFEGQSFAFAVNRDGSIIVGFSLDPVQEVGRAWTWTRRDGIQAIPMPDATVGSQAVDIADDGTVVGSFTFTTEDGTLRTEPFLWSAERGFNPLSGWGTEEGDPVSMTPVAISADGLSIVFDQSSTDTTDTLRGADIAQFGEPFGQGLWAQYSVTPENQPYLTPNQGACSRDVSAIGGYIHFDGSWVTPAVWTPGMGIRALAPGVVGRTWAVSPDGMFAGGGNHDAGTAFIWNTELGFENLVVYLQQLDYLFGTTVLAVFDDAGYPSVVNAFAADNRRLIGVAGTSIFGNPCRGFVLDLP